MITTYFRSNYFLPINLEAFQGWCEEHNLTILLSEKHPGLVGFQDDGSGEHSVIEWIYAWDEKTKSMHSQDTNLMYDLAPLLANGHVAIVVEKEKNDFPGEDDIWYAYATNNKGKYIQIDQFLNIDSTKANLLESIYKEAQALGDFVTQYEDKENNNENTR